jgi:hypothetical protein
MIEVELSDGSIFEVDTNDPEVARRAAVKFMGGDKSPGMSDGKPPGMLDSALDTAKRKAAVTASGVAEGVSALVGLPDMLAPRVAPGSFPGVRAFSEDMRKAFGYPAGPDPAGARDALPTKEGVRSALSGVVPVANPETADERILHSFGMLAGSAPVPAAMLPAAAGAVVGEGARQGSRMLGLGPQGQSNAETAGHILGSFGPSVYGALRSGTTGRMLGDATRDVAPEQWLAAERLASDAQRMGLPLTGPEAIPSPALRRLASDTRAHPAGGPAIERFLQERPAAAARAGESAASVFSPRQDPAQVAEGIQQAAEAVLQRAVRARTAATSPHYQAAEATLIPEPDIDYLVKMITDRARDTSADAARELFGLADRIRSNPTIGSVSAEVKALADAARVDGTMAALDRSQAAKTATARGGPALRATEQTMEAVSPQYAAAQDTFRRMSPAIDELTSGPIGALSRDITPGGRGTAALQERLLLDPAATSPGTIRSVTQQLARERPEALSDFVGEYLRRTFDTAAKPVQGQANPAVAANWSKAIAGTPRQRENLTALVEEAARASGQNPSGVSAGFNRLLEIADRTATIPGVGSQTAGRTEAYSRGGELLALQWRRFVQRRLQAGQFRELGELFTQPDSVRALREIAVTGPNTTKERAALAALMSTLDATQE